MKLRNKKTGDRGVINYFDNQSIVIYPIDENWNAKGDKKYVYHSLTELNAEWEDYEEPSKTIWQIKDSGELQDFEEDDFSDGYIESSKSIGNYFETKEEAEKAVEKLKAWKRLKEKGFRFDGWDENHHNLGIIEFSFDKVENNVWDFEKDLDLLFGGEE